MKSVTSLYRYKLGLDGLDKLEHLMAAQSSYLGLSLGLNINGDVIKHYVEKMPKGVTVTNLQNCLAIWIRMARPILDKIDIQYIDHGIDVVFTEMTAELITFSITIPVKDNLIEPVIITAMIYTNSPSEVPELDDKYDFSKSYITRKWSNYYNPAGINDAYKEMAKISERHDKQMCYDVVRIDENNIHEVGIAFGKYRQYEIAMAIGVPEVRYDMHLVLKTQSNE